MSDSARYHRRHKEKSNISRENLNLVEKERKKVADRQAGAEEDTQRALSVGTHAACSCEKKNTASIVTYIIATLEARAPNIPHRYQRRIYTRTTIEDDELYAIDPLLGA